MKEIYSDLDKLKELAEKLGYTIGPCTIDEDEPFVKIKIEIVKNRNGTEHNSNAY